MVKPIWATIVGAASLGAGSVLMVLLMQRQSLPAMALLRTRICRESRVGEDCIVVGARAVRRPIALGTLVCCRGERSPWHRAIGGLLAGLGFLTRYGARSDRNGADGRRPRHGETINAPNCYCVSLPSAHQRSASLPVDHPQSDQHGQPLGPRSRAARSSHSRGRSDWRFIGTGTSSPATVGRNPAKERIGSPLSSASPCS